MPPPRRRPTARPAPTWRACWGWPASRGYGRRDLSEVTRLLVMPVRDPLDEWFASAELKGLLASVGVRGLDPGPFAGGTAFNLLHHLAIGDGFLSRDSARRTGRNCPGAGPRGPGPRRRDPHRSGRIYA